MEVKVGQYIRTPKGIRKVHHVSNRKTVRKYSCKGRNDLHYEDYELIRTTDVLKVADNIIDLIEPLDYVNGHKVYVDWSINELVIRVDNEDPDKVWQKLKDIEIKTIVISEQFENLEYRVGDEIGRD